MSRVVWFGVAIRWRYYRGSVQSNFNLCIISAVIPKALDGAPEEIRTPDPQIRSLVLAPPLAMA